MTCSEQSRAGHTGARRSQTPLLGGLQVWNFLGLQMARPAGPKLARGRGSGDHSRPPEASRFYIALGAFWAIIKAKNLNNFALKIRKFYGFWCGIDKRNGHRFVGGLRPSTCDAVVWQNPMIGYEYPSGTLVLWCIEWCILLDYKPCPEMPIRVAVSWWVKIKSYNTKSYPLILFLLYWNWNVPNDIEIG